MLPNIISMIVTIVAGVLIAFVNYTVSKHILIKAPDKYSFTVVIHQMLQIAFLAAVYFIASGMTGLNIVYPLVGSVLGMTAPMFFFTKKLANPKIRSKLSSDHPDLQNIQRRIPKS